MLKIKNNCNLIIEDIRLTRDIKEQNYRIRNYPFEKPTFGIVDKDKELNSYAYHFIDNSLKEDFTNYKDIKIVYIPYFCAII